MREIENVQPRQLCDVRGNAFNAVVSKVEVLHGELPVVGSTKGEVLQLVVTHIQVHLKA